MEQINETFRTGLVHRAVAFGLALTTTALVATSTAVVFTNQAQGTGALLHAAATSIRTVMGS